MTLLRRWPGAPPELSACPRLRGDHGDGSDGALWGEKMRRRRRKKKKKKLSGEKKKDGGADDPARSRRRRLGPTGKPTLREPPRASGFGSVFIIFTPYLPLLDTPITIQESPPL